ncbi:hypothetical protein [Flagellimonas sp.]|uniref:hypothetical protein n=1 Tax=Flagellimonas sp. TaxID=2058762 RepID=UPI003F4A5051
MSKLIPKILSVFAMAGIIILFLQFGLRPTGHIFSKYYIEPPGPSLIAAALVLPYLVYLITSKSKQKKVLNSNPIDLNKMGLTTMDYFDRKAEQKFVEIYVKNETSDKLIVNRKSLLEPNRWHIFKMDKHKSIYFSNGIALHVDEELNLEIDDFRNQIIELKDDYFEKYNVPEYVNWAFAIAKPNMGDVLE